MYGIFTDTHDLLRDGSCCYSVRIVQDLLQRHRTAMSQLFR